MSIWIRQGEMTLIHVHHHEQSAICFVGCLEISGQQDKQHGGEYGLDVFSPIFQCQLITPLQNLCCLYVHIILSNASIALICIDWIRLDFNSSHEGTYCAGCKEDTDIVISSP